MGEAGLGRPVTDVEAQILGVLLETIPGSEEERIRRSGLPRTTFQVAKKRLYDHGLLEDRYLPHPAVFGFPVATFILASPFAEHSQAMTSALAEEAGSVLVWTGRSTILAVLLHRSTADARRTLGQLTRKGNGRMVAVEANLALPTVPCYFDFEGIWKRILGRPGVVGYPRPLGGPFQTGFGRRPGRGDFEAARRLADRPFHVGEEGLAAHLLGPHTLPRSQRKLLRKGWAQWRVFPGFPAFPVHAGMTVTDVILITGRLREGASAQILFREIVGDCRVFPFLYASDERTVLLAGLGTGDSGIRPARGRRRSVISTLSQSLVEIEVIREPATSLTVPVNHRYERLVPGTGWKALRR